MEPSRDDLTVRCLREADLARLVRMDERITGRNRRAWYERKLKKALEESDVRVSLGAESGGILVGAVLGSLHYGEFGQPEPVAVLDTILVDEGFRGRGSPPRCSPRWRATSARSGSSGCAPRSPGTSTS